MYFPGILVINTAHEEKRGDLRIGHFLCGINQIKSSKTRIIADYFLRLIRDILQSKGVRAYDIHDFKH